MSDGKGPTNIDLGRATLYTGDGAAWSAEQVAAHLSAPDAIYFSNPTHCNVSPISLELLRSLTGFLLEENLGPQVGPVPVRDTGFLIVLGVGLGYHLPELVARTTARHIVLVEPYPEFLCHSCLAIDWSALFDAAEERGLRLHFILENQPQEMSRAVEKIVVAEGNTFLEGTAFLPHYFAWALKEAYRLLREHLKTLYTSSGFFEDELEMVRNTNENLKACDFHLVQGRAHLEQSFPVFLVGSGPSLDENLGHIRRLRDKAIVVSCGTALRILLKNGIRPDLHCENERVALVTDLVTACRDQYGLHGITLLATTTMFPEVASMFDARWIYYRYSLSPAVLLNPGISPLYNADPLVINAAFSAMTFLGFSNLYLFGTDLARIIHGAD